MADDSSVASSDDFYNALDTTDEIDKEQKLTEDGGVIKTILRPGTGFQKPEKGDEVEVHYVGMLASDGSQFDSSRDRNQTFKFDLGKGRVIKGWDIGVGTMKKGEKSVLTLAPEYGYGAAGSPPKIPENSTLKFEVELLGWKSIKDILGDGSLLKTIVKEGEGWEKPLDKDEAKVWYEVTVKGQDAPVYTTPESGEEFTVADGANLQAIDKVIKDMKRGAELKLEIKPKHGFQTPPAGVPKDADLLVSLKLLSWKKVEDVTKDGGVVKKMMVPGKDWTTPNAGAMCTISYTLRDASGNVTEEKSDFEFVTEEGVLPEGLEAAIMKMKAEEEALITLSGKYAVDAEGKQAGTALRYTVKLLKFVNAKESWEVDDTEKTQLATALKDKGNEFFKAQKYALAVKKYKRAADMLGADASLTQDQKKQAGEVKKSCNLNMAQVYLKQQDYKQAKAACDKVLETDGFNMKALYRRAQAHMGLQNYVETSMDVKKALEQEPENKDFLALKKRLKAQESVAAKQEAKMYSNMFKAFGGGKSGAAKA